MDDAGAGWGADPRHVARHRGALRAALADYIEAADLESATDAALAIVARYVDLVGAGLNDARQNTAERRSEAKRARKALGAFVDAADALGRATAGLGDAASDSLHEYRARLRALGSEAGSLSGAAEQARARLLEPEAEMPSPRGGPRRDEAAALMLQDAARLWTSRTGRGLTTGGGDRRSPWERFAVAICKAAGAPKGVALARDAARAFRPNADR